MRELLLLSPKILLKFNGSYPVLTRGYATEIARMEHQSFTSKLSTMKYLGNLALCILQIASVNDMYKRLQEYNTSLQEYNCKLQLDLNTASENLKRCETDKAAVVEDLTGIRVHYNSVNEQLTSLKVRYHFLF